MRLLLLLTTLALLVGARWAAVRNHQRCEASLSNCLVGLEIYATDNGGRYPPSAKLLTPSYLSAIPTCASSGRAYVFHSSPDFSCYTVACSGLSHWWAGVTRPGFPQRDTINSFCGRPDSRPGWRQALDL